MSATTIWKFTLNPFDPVTKMPRGAQTLYAREQAETVCVWALVQPDEPTEERVFHTYGTGHPMPDNPGRYLGSAHMMDGTLVFHIFEETK